MGYDKRSSRAKNQLCLSSHFDIVLACDGQTDGHTQNNGIYHASLASHGNKSILSCLVSCCMCVEDWWLSVVRWWHAWDTRSLCRVIHTSTTMSTGTIAPPRRHLHTVSTQTLSRTRGSVIGWLVYHRHLVARPLCEHSCFHGLPPWRTILRLTISWV